MNATGAGAGAAGPRTFSSDEPAIALEAWPVHATSLPLTYNPAPDIIVSPL